MSSTTWSKSGSISCCFINDARAWVSFGKHIPSNGLPASVPYFPILLSRETPKLTILSSTPTLRQIMPISLKNEIFSERKQFEAYFISSAASKDVTIILSVNSLYIDISDSDSFAILAQYDSVWREKIIQCRILSQK